MNKYITLLLLSVLMAAMVLVLFVQIKGGSGRPEPGQPTPPLAEHSQLRPETPAAQATPRPSGIAPLPPQAPAGQARPDKPQARPLPAEPAPPDVTPAPGQATPAPSPGQAVQVKPAAPAPTVAPVKATPAPNAAPARALPAEPAPTATQGKPTPAPAELVIAPAQQAARPTPPVTPVKPALAAQSAGRIVDLSLHFRDQGMFLSIEGDGPLAVKYFVLTQPERLVIDLPGEWLGLKAPTVPGNTLIKSARSGRQDNADRLVLDLLAPISKHELRRVNDKKVEIYFQQ